MTSAVMEKCILYYGGFFLKIIECQYNFAVNKNWITTEQWNRIDVFTFRHLCL